MEFVISYDMRAPDFGAPAREIYAAALDQCEWADGLGFDAIGLGEHHASDDGYLPSPIPMAGAIGASTVMVFSRALAMPIAVTASISRGHVQARPAPARLSMRQAPSSTSAVAASGHSGGSKRRAK